MKLTNKLDLPQAIVDAVRNDGYTKGDADISVTGLLRPPRLAELERQFHDLIEEDVSDRVWSLFGQSIHTILERANRVGVAERRLSIEIEGWKISGGMDLFEENGTLSDYKTTSVWKLVKGDIDEWTKQLNMYSAILRNHGHEVKNLQVIAILRDWSKMEAARDHSYPQAQVVNVLIPVWDQEKTIRFMRDRVILHKQARVKLPECSSEDRWARPDTWAVMKVGAKRASRVYENDTEALAHKGFDKNLEVIRRPGVSVRCEGYCRVSKFCAQFRAFMAQPDRPTDESSSKEAV